MDGALEDIKRGKVGDETCKENCKEKPKKGRRKIK